MKEISGSTFLSMLEKETEFSNLIIRFERSILVKHLNISKRTFENCTFKGEKLQFSDLKFGADPKIGYSFHFHNCEFENEVNFISCAIADLSFQNCYRAIKSLYVSDSKIGYFSFHNDEIQNEKSIPEINIFVSRCGSIRMLDFLRLQSIGKLHMNNCVIDEWAYVHSSSFARADIADCRFLKDFQFTHSRIRDSYFTFNEFNKTDFSNTSFGNDTDFSFNDFKGTTLFQNLADDGVTTVKFKSCNFMKYTYFNGSALDVLHIDTSKFQEFASFQELKLNSIFLDRTVFEKPAFFDDIEIRRFKECSQRTLRNIKQQLLRTDNRIDYDNFRAEELNAYKKELKTKLKKEDGGNKWKLRGDLIILWVNSFFSNNGTDWFRALIITLVGAFVFYSIFFISHNYQRPIELGNYSEYFIGLFRFFLLTDFHNPLVDNREYISEVWEWVPFVFGKIFIAIGIYELLVSFRKFRK